jgi:Domain of unknown function (DUF1772)
MLKALFALVAAALFAGAALYVTLAEHPARMRLADEHGLAQWKASYARAAPMQVLLALLSLALGVWAWWKTDEIWLLAGALLIAAAIPLTLIVILPVTRRLQATAAGAAGADTRALLTRWGRLHLLRTLLGLAAVAAYLAAILWR